MTSPTPILYPAFAMLLLVFIVLNRMRSLRFAAVRNREISVEFYMVGCAWLYVALRYAHSYVHLTTNDVRSGSASTSRAGSSCSSCG
jgi:hypothetical protein